MKSPDDVRGLLRRRFDQRHRDWLAETSGDDWPLEISLGLPTEQAALNRLDAMGAWITAWHSWRGEGQLQWTERRWRMLGTQRMPALLRIDGPHQVAIWLGEAERWHRARQRHDLLSQRWPSLMRRLGRLFAVLADYPDPDFERLVATLDWLERHPDSGMYLRQLPIPGLDTKWMETRKAVLAELLCCIRGTVETAADFYALCGLRRMPALVRMRVLDPVLRARLGGISDLSVPVGDLARLDFYPRRVIIVENLQTGLALEDLAGAVAFMALGYGVDVLSQLQWLDGADCIYWGDIDTHGFSILNRARSHMPALRSILMDEQTLLSHRAFWTSESDQHAAQDLPHLFPEEQAVYRALKTGNWGSAIRLEQERIDWKTAWSKLSS